MRTKKNKKARLLKQVLFQPIISIKQLKTTYKKTSRKDRFIMKQIGNQFSNFFLNDKTILSLILLNSFILFISGFDIQNNIRLFLIVIDNILTIFFVLELIFKLAKSGFSFFDSKWNTFDFILIVISVPSLLAFILNASITDFSFLLVFRVLRVFKSFRFLKFIPGMAHIIKGVMRALKASFLVILGLSIYIFIIGILSFYLFRNSASDFFANPLVSLYSTFQIFTVEGWTEIPRSITRNYSSTASFFTHLYFIFVLLSGGIFGLSFVNSIFVDAMVSDNNDELAIKIDNLDKKLSQFIQQTERTRN